ncbi:MAG: Crp/Fnr family transcriptional regulator [Ferruginibacter sp.]|nr:Crp/Fnr family transcriptional regulator [Cytophagales bacterium]
MTNLLAEIDALVARLPATVQQALDRVTSRQTFARGDYLLRQGDVCRYTYFIETGLARKYYLVDGREITTEFYFSQDLALSMTSYTIQVPSQEFIQALENTTALRTDYRAFQALKTQFPVLMELDLRLTEYYALWQEERLRQFRTLDATQRYERLLRTQSQWVQHLQLTHIASYLGVSIETLSRIRAKLASTNRI